MTRKISSSVWVEEPLATVSRSVIHSLIYSCLPGMTARTNAVFHLVVSKLLGLRHLVLVTGSRFTNRRFVFTLAALAILTAKLIHIYSHAKALTTHDLVKWGYSFFTQDVLLLTIIRFLLDSRHFPPAGSRSVRTIACFISSLFIGFVTTINIINICFFAFNGSEIHWRNVGVAGDAAGRALVLSGLVSSLVVIGVLALFSWSLQDVVFAAVGFTIDIITWIVAYATRGRFYGVQFQSPNDQYYQIAQSDMESAAKTVEGLERKPIKLTWIQLVLYIFIAVALLAQIIESLARPHDRSLTFMSWTPALLPFVDFETTALNLENIYPHYNSGINHEWDNRSALRKPIPLPWLPDYPLGGFEDWYEDGLHYDALADPFKISNMEEALLPQLGDLNDMPIRHVMIVVLESTRKDVFPIKDSGIIAKRLRDSWDDNKLPEDVAERLKTLTPVARFLTGDYDNHFDHTAGEEQKKRGGINFNDAYTASTLTLKSLTASLCGVSPMVADFNVEYKHHVYQPCLPHILGALNTLARKDQGRYEFGGYKWASTFMQSVTLSYDHFGALMEKIGFPSEGLIDKEYLTKKTAKFGKVDLPDINYFGFEETPLEDYIRDEFEKAKKNDGRVFLTHITSTTHHPYNMPKNETYVPLGKGLSDLSHYINAVGYDDRWLGRILDTLDDLNVANETLLIFVGDHGLSIPENDILASYYNPHIANNHVPLVLSHPKLPPITIDDAVSTQQILPTILDLLIETGSLSESAANAARDLLVNYEGQSLLRPVRKALSKTGIDGEVANWQFTNINPGSTMLDVRDARFKSWRIVVPLVGNQEWQFLDTERPDVKAVVGFEFSEFQQNIEESYGQDPARWVEEAAFVARWFVNENSKRWRYSLYEP
ncbi:sulfatase domain protein [Talaromyces stipitatus ATCC 10500]|uniref:Sulfatase domain protein n=1 Tax=Talaromyces stipitatus (strain ATCC 10500 / CBS 375.48 / QM 6759 / NRRL 1006) TaxID=441959 RepID=B8MDI5_TALSN|nr:sulfatase domain protein [Talaromyces stipitatus ATCC 10500]EED17948.1 sulfatase domain protein [Talaromyces stipitatus ATCC 10500]